MIKYELNYEHLIERNIHSDFKIVEITDDDIIQHCIDLFHSEVIWDDMFNVKEALNRIERGEKMFVGYKDKDIFCYCWLKQNDKHIYHIYNVFSKKPKSLRKIGVIDLLYLVIKYHTIGKITSEADEWNIQSHKVIHKLGFKQI